MGRYASWLIFLALCPVVAHAHAFPERSIPRVGRSVAQSPPEVKITFDADLEPLFSSIVVKNANQIVVSDAASTVSPTKEPRENKLTIISFATEGARNSNRREIALVLDSTHSIPHH